MINTSDEVLFVETLTEEDIQCAFAKGRQDLEESANKQRLKPFRKQVSQFDRLVRAARDYKNPHQLVADISGLVMNETAPTSDVSMNSGFNGFVPGREAHLNLKRFACNFLFHLWCQRKIALPYRFNFQRRVGKSVRRRSPSEVARFLADFVELPSDQLNFGKSVGKRMQSHCWVWLHTTTWVNFQDICLDDYKILCEEMAARARSADKTNSPSTATLFVSVATSRFPEKLSYSEQSLKAVQDSIRAESAQSGVHKRLSQDISKELDTDIQSLRLSPETTSFMKINPRVAGTEYQLSSSELSLWERLFESYLSHRQIVQGHEDTKAVSVSLRKLANYISYYLPAKLMGRALPPEYLVRAPKDFLRSRHIDRTISDDNIPTYHEFIGSFSQCNDTRRAWIRHASLFFEWIEVSYSEQEYEGIAGPSFRNPISRELDQPISRKRSGTNKKNISRDTLPHLLLWLYEVEKVGLHLQEMEKKGHSTGLPTELSASIDYCVRPQDYGLVSSYETPTGKFRVDRVPVRLLRSGNLSGPIWLSHLRWQILALETGLGHQAIQWLDRRSWNQSCSGKNKEVYQLYANTDKVHESFKTPVLHRVWELLHRQSEQESVSGNRWLEVPYERRQHSRFSAVEHLFRNHLGKFIADSSYAEYWKILLFSFQSYLGWSNIPAKNIVHYKAPDKILKKRDNRSRFSICVLNWQYEHTPHSCRSTFVTLRSPFVDLGAIARVIGHTNEIATHHYVYSDFEDLSLKLEAADALSLNCTMSAITSGPAYVNAKEKNSALRKSFGIDRNATIQDFLIFNLTAIHQEGEKSGLDLLRSSRATEIVFRDTHICPIGELCPAEVVEETGGTLRCGACRFACKSVDHLPAIEAKRNALMGRIRSSLELLQEINRAKEREDERSAILREINLDSYELMGWSHSVEVLKEGLERARSSDEYLTGKPETVRLHLKRVTQNQDQQEFLLQRIIDADAFPGLASDELRLKTSRLTRVLKNDDMPKDFLAEVDRDFEIRAMAASIHTRLQANNVSLKAISQELKALARPTQAIPLRTAGKEL